VITSLCEAETKAKCAFILKVRGQGFTSKAIRLRCTRTFVHRTIDLRGSMIKAERLDLVEKHVKDLLDQVIAQAEQERDEAWRAKKPYKVDLDDNGDGIPEELRLPYIRLKVDYSGGYSVLAPRVFARHAEGRVANPNDCVVFFKGNSYKGGLT